MMVPRYGHIGQVFTMCTENLLQMMRMLVAVQVVLKVARKNWEKDAEKDAAAACKA